MSNNKKTTINKKKSINKTERELFSQPIKSGGLGIQKLSEKSTMEYEASKLITAPLTSVIVM